MKAIALIFTIALALGGVGRLDAQATPAALAVAPASASAAVGTTVSMDVTIAGVAAPPGLGGYDVTVSYDPAIVRLDALTDAGVFDGGPNIVICVPSQIDNAAGKASITCTPVPLFSSPGPGFSSPAPLLHLSFTALSPGASSIDLAGSTLQAPDASTLASTLAGGRLAVTAGAAQPTPTAPTTPTATSAAAASATPQVTAPATAAVSTATLAPSPVSSRPTETVRPPQTGDGGSSGGNAGALAVAGVLAAAAVLAVSGSAIWFVRRSRS
jgi:hypothetical protein